MRQTSSSLLGGHTLGASTGFASSNVLLSRRDNMALTSTDDSSEIIDFKPRCSLSLAYEPNAFADARSSSSFSAGPLTPPEDPLPGDDASFAFPSHDKAQEDLPNHLFYHQRSVLTASDNPNLSLSSLPEIPTVPLPSSISSFEIFGTLGRGTYGKVLLGTHATQPGLRAIKVLQKTGMDRYGKEEAERELRTLKTFSEASTDTRTLFLQGMVNTFSDARFVFLVLVSISRNHRHSLSVVQTSNLGISSNPTL